jgi:hypothetical protein
MVRAVYGFSESDEPPPVAATVSVPPRFGVTVDDEELERDDEEVERLEELPHASSAKPSATPVAPVRKQRRLSDGDDDPACRSGHKSPSVAKSAVLAGSL